MKCTFLSSELYFLLNVMKINQFTWIEVTKEQNGMKFKV